MASKKQYVNNQEFLIALRSYLEVVEPVKKQYQSLLKKAKADKLPKDQYPKWLDMRPPVPDYIGECILKIAEHLSYRPNFLNYPFREEMIGDGIENCLLYIDSYDPTRKNPHAYFTQIVWYAFVRRILREKKQLYIKYKCIQSSNEFTDYVNQKHDTKVYDNTYIDFLRKNMGDIITEFESKKKEKKKKINPNSLEKFFDDAPPIDELPFPIPSIDEVLETEDEVA